MGSGRRRHVPVGSAHSERGRARGQPRAPHRIRAPHRRAHQTPQDLERYGGLFAERTRVMRSWAMRDLMAITARPEVISLAGGLPGHLDLPAASFAAQMTRIAQESAAEALQYGPTEGFAETKECDREVMARRGHDCPTPRTSIVTTGGQQAIDLVAKTLVDPGDSVICEAPTYPGAVPVFCSYQAERSRSTMDDEGMRIDELEAAARAARPREGEAEVHLHGAELPEPGRRDDVRASGAGGWSSWPESGKSWSSRTTRTACCATRAAERAALQARRRRLRDLRRHLLEDPLAGDPAGLGRRAAAGDGEDRARQAGDRPLHLDADPVLRRSSTFAEEHWRAYVDSLCGIYRAPRRDARGARPTIPGEATWTRPQGGLFVWATLPRYIDTSDLLAKALRENVAFVPGAAAYVDGARGANSMRLNFSGSSEDEIREGIRRIGKVIGEQVAFYETITGEHPLPGPPARAPPHRRRRSAACGRRGCRGLPCAAGEDEG